MGKYQARGHGVRTERNGPHTDNLLVLKRTRARVSKF